MKSSEAEDLPFVRCATDLGDTSKLQVPRLLTPLVPRDDTAIFMGGTIECFRDTVFNYATLAGAYEVALDGLNKL